MTSILAVDPGGTTGIALYRYETRRWRTWQMSYRPIVLYSFFQTALAADVDTKVICESFDYRPAGKYDFGGSKAIPKVDLTPVRVIGLLDLACAYSPHVEVIWQKPSIVNGDQGKKTKDPTVFWTDEKVKQLGLYQTAHVHAMDAVKHILHHRTFTLGEENLLHALRPQGKYDQALGEVMHEC